MTGENLKQDGISRVIASNPDWVASAIALINSLVRSNGRVTADDLRSAISFPPPHPNCVGAAFGSAAKQGLIRASGSFIKSVHPATHARRIGVWLLPEAVTPAPAQKTLNL